jgi:hypothetical protein
MTELLALEITELATAGGRVLAELSDGRTRLK